MSIQVKKDMEDVYLDPCSAHNSRLPLPLSTVKGLSSTSFTTHNDANNSGAVHNLSTDNSSPLNSVTAALESPKTGVGQLLLLWFQYVVILWSG